MRCGFSLSKYKPVIASYLSAKYMLKKHTHIALYYKNLSPSNINFLLYAYNESQLGGK